jgi:hypothetical protein
VSPLAIHESVQSAFLRLLENTTLGMEFMGSAKMSSPVLEGKYAAMDE